jgi:hypothetical protein
LGIGNSECGMVIPQILWTHADKTISLVLSLRRLTKEHRVRLPVFVTFSSLLRKPPEDRQVYSISGI